MTAKCSAKSAAATSSARTGRKLVVKKDKNKLVGNVSNGSTTERCKIWTWENAATRAIKLKLGSYPNKKVDCNKDANGILILPKVIEELQRLRPQRKHVTVSFWNDIIAQHNLSGGWASDLPAPDAAQPVDKELNSALGACHMTNPAQKSAQKLMRWLTYSGPCNRTEFVGLLAGSAEGPSMSANMSHGILGGMLKYVARTRAHEEHEDLWNLVKTHFDGILVRAWARAQSKKTTRTQFLRTYRQELQVFLDMADAVATNAAVEDDDPGSIDASVVDKLSSSSLIGSELFAPERCAVELKAFIKDAVDRLSELEAQGFTEQEVESFKSIMGAHSATFDDNVWQFCSSSTISLQFLGATCKHPLVHPNDHWNFRLQAAQKTLAISNGSLARTIWEVWLFGQSTPIDGVTHFTKIDECLIYDAANAREWLGNKMKGVTSAVKAKDIVRSNSDELIRMDEYFGLELEFLMNHFDALMEDRMRNLMLEVAPSPGEKRILSKAVAAARQLSVGPLALAQKTSIQTDMTTAANAILDMSTGSSPTSKELSQMTTWLLCFHKRCENFAHVVVDAAASCSSSSKSAKRHLFGAAAIQHRLKTCRDAPDGAQEDTDLKELRMFRWLLSDAELKELSSWTSSKVQTSRDRLMNRQKALQDIEKKAKAKRSQEKVDDQLQPLMAPPLKKKGKEKPEQGNPPPVIDEDDERDAEDANGSNETSGLLSFFGAKAI